MSLCNPLDMWSCPANALQDLNNKMVSFFQSLITHSSRASEGSAFNGLYDNSLNLSEYLVYLVLVMVIVMVGFLRKKERLPHALFVFFLMAAFSPLWLNFVGKLQDFGDAGSQAMNFYTPGGSGMPPLPIFDNSAARFFGTLMAIYVGAWLTAFILSYEYFVVLFKFWGPIAYSISAWGKRSKQFSNLVISLGLVATAIGRPFVSFFIEMGQVAVDTFPFGNTAPGQTFYIVMAYVGAFWSQIILIVVCYVGISKVEGYIMATAKGAVDSSIKGTPKVDVQKIRSNHAAGVTPLPVHVVKPPLAKRAAKNAAEAAGSAAARRVATVAAAATAATGHVWASGLIKGAGGLFRK